ncbi:phosphatase PAP2 family protein [Actinoplanes xinjiangensis]|nr:phosphatase PAP2 family protein [Actinoplanes xinjiangensis]
MVATTSLLGAVAVGLALTPWQQVGNDPAVVRTGWSVDLYRAVTATTAGWPSWAGTVGRWLPGAALLLLGALAVAAAEARHDGSRRRHLAVAMLGVLAAYLISEVLKHLVQEVRPCAVLLDVRTLEHCPPLGRWSYPSNHATVAGALAAFVVAAAPRLAVIAVPLALMAASARLFLGLHYPHDVVGGLLIGTAAGFAVWTLLRSTQRPATALLHRPT